MTRLFWAGSVAISATMALGFAPGMTSSASAETIFAQTPTPTPSGFLLGGGNQVRFADDFMLDTADTARSVTWRGSLGSNDDLLFPMSFSLVIFENDDSDDLPGLGVSNTTVTFTDATNVVDTGEDSGTGADIYEFSADLQAVALDANRVYWFALRLEDIPAGNNFFWSTGDGERAAFQNNNGSFRESRFGGPFYFTLDNEAIPEPATLAALVALAPLARRRNRRG